MAYGTIGLANSINSFKALLDPPNLFDKIIISNLSIKIENKKRFHKFYKNFYKIKFL